MANTKTPPPHKEAKWVASRGLVKMSVSCLSVSMYFITMSPFSTWSLKKWYFTFMCFALPWEIGFWVSHMTLELSHMRGNTLVGHSIISHGLHYPEDLGAIASSSYILSLSGELYDRRLFVSWPTNKRRSKKMTCTRSAFSINPTTCKISIGKANKIKQRRSRVSNPKFECVFEIPEALLNCCPMWRAWRSLKECTQAHSELNVRPCCHEVQEGANHAPALSLINSLTIFIWIQCHCRAHRRWHGLELSHIEFLYQVFCVLGLMYKDVLLRLLHLNT
jgi:hypothetical protein